MHASQFAPTFWRHISAAVIFSFAAASAQTVAPTTPATPTATTRAAGLPTIFVVGDSTAKNNAGGAQGWGTAIEAYIDPAKAVVNNVAHAGQSSRTYYNLASDWPRALPLIKAGDYVLLVFGINDGSTPDGLGDEVKQTTNPRTGQVEDTHTYGWYMSKMAVDAEAKGAQVYLLTVTTRNIWTNPKAKFRDATIVSQDDGYNPAEDKIERGTGNGKYTQWTKDVGAKLHVPVLDLTNLEADHYEKLGREKVMVNYLDHNHTKPAGADMVASYIISGLKAFKSSPFTAMLSEKGKAVETADAKYVSDNAVPTAPAKTTDTSTPAVK